MNYQCNKLGWSKKKNLVPRYCKQFDSICKMLLLYIVYNYGDKISSCRWAEVVRKNKKKLEWCSAYLLEATDT